VVDDRDDATMPDTRAANTEPVPRVSSNDLGERYEVGPLLGRGGMGEVRLARDLRIDREVAVKLMRGAHRDEVTLGRFFREARVQGVLEHPAVVPVHDLGIDREGNPYFVMKRLSGTTLHDVIANPSEDKWPRRTVLARLIDVCLAIEFAHTRGVIHRDLKPANIMLGDFGEAFVLDWGLARISDEGDSFRGVAPLSGDGNGQTVAGDLLGTPGYMSPEQARGEVVDWRTDVFALGCVLFEILAGVPALSRGMAGLAEAISSPHHRPSERSADVPPELDDLCVRATTAEAKARPTARELAGGIQAYLDGDRDVVRRRELADAAVQAAREAKISGDRATAMREAGRALALEPDHQRAQELLAALLFELPDTMPAEALVAADLERGEVRRRVIRKAAATHLVATGALAILLVLPVRHYWPIVFGMMMSTATAALAYVMSKRPMPMASPLFIVFGLMNCLTIATGGLLFGVLLIMPMFIIGSLSAFMSQPVRHSPWTMVILHVVPVALLLALELSGALPRSFELSGGTLVITPYTVDLSPLTLVVVFVLSFGVQVGSTFDIQYGFRQAQETAQNKIHAQTWHLKQLLPRSDKLDTGPVPKQ
jgi:eukaryotic-like serine/threonine-protein kinase